YFLPFTPKTAGRTSRQKRRPSLADGAGEFFDHRDGGVPADAAVGDADAVDELVALGDELLGTFLEVALDHDRAEGGVASGDLGGEIGADPGLFVKVLFAVGVAAIDHDGGFESFGLEGPADFADAPGVVVGSGGGAAAEDDVA